MADFWRAATLALVRGMGAKIVSILPGVLAMLVLVILGVVFGALARAILTRLARALDLDGRTQAWGLSAALARAGIRRSLSGLVGLLAFWGVFVFFATMGIDALAIPGAPGATEALARLIPRLLAGVLILAVGWLAANFVGQAILVAAVNAGLPEARLLARACRWGVLLFAIATTLTQIGIGRDMVMMAFAITFGGLVFSLALAFGLGGRGLAREILERRLRRERPPRSRETIHL